VKQIAQYQDGRLELQDVPPPTAPHGGVVVRVTHSVVSAGTERMKVEQARMNLVQKARARPDQVRKVLDTAKTLGWRAAIDKVRNRLETPTPLGYSAAGVVVAVHPANGRLRVGDRVACGGAECAFHAEYIAVPDMLTASVPNGVENWRAAYTTIASIALQTVRQLQPALGDRVMVTGQGLIGLLVTALLRAHGARVLAVDLSPAREQLARTMGAELYVAPGARSLDDEVRAWTDGYGADAVVLATATADNAPTLQAIHCLRDRGRVVVVGNTRVDLPWKDAYEKEIEVRYARSYGPGRYDPAYEWGGTDYPIGHVRWTEQRNFEACLHLMRTGELDVGALTTRRVPFKGALEVYRDLVSGQAQDVGVVLEYEDASSRLPAPASMPSGVQANGARQTRTSGSTRVRSLDVIGAGNFARTMLLPHLQGVVPFGTVVNNTALSATHVKTKFAFQNAATDYASLFEQPTVHAEAGDDGTRAPSAVLIATRHHLHAPLVLSALAADRHVFVEKPLCLDLEELHAIDRAVEKSAGSVLVGFNRRFAGASVALKQMMAEVTGPKVVSYRVVPGRLDPQHWYANYAESGGRVLGEACHFLDYFCFLLDADPVRVSAQTTWPATGRLPFPDNVAAQIEFGDGSCGQLIYGEGDSSWPKEQCTVYGSGLVAEVTNFQQLVVHRGRRKTTRSFTGKGHAEEMRAWGAFLRGNGPHPLPYVESRRSMQLTFAVLDSIQQGRSVDWDS
jgi:predicted dehydrogenase/threonine dehydrogenase-like Zn-dependent dehydrogenase